MISEWIPVTREDQIKVGTPLKIVGFNPKDSYKRITAKEVLGMKNVDGSWVEIVINTKKNYYFNLTAYLNGTKTWGKWVKELYYKEESNV